MSHLQGHLAAGSGGGEAQPMAELPGPGSNAATTAGGIQPQPESATELSGMSLWLNADFKKLSKFEALIFEEISPILYSHRRYTSS